ncbi:MAG: hypothetical protein IJ787_06550 [Bacilli bacterium]|nr:hypothetical protein [Bacilli bacterium]
MNKLFRKIGMALVGMAMAVGVSVAIGSNRETLPVTAAAETTTYTLNGESWTSAAGNWTSLEDLDGSVATGRYAVTSSNPAAVSPDSYNNISSIVVTGTKSSKGASTVEMLYGPSSSGPWTTLGSKSFATTMTWSPSDVAGYLKIQTTYSKANTYIASIAVTHDEAGGSDPLISVVTTKVLAPKNTAVTLSAETENEPDGYTIAWSTSDGTLSSTSGNSTSFTVSDAKNVGDEVTITADLKNGSGTTVASRTKSLYVSTKSGESIAQAIPASELKTLVVTKGLTLGTNVHVKGFVTTYTNATTVWLGDEKGGSNQFELYGSITNDTGNALAKDKFVVAHGTPVKFNSTAEFNGTTVIDRIDYVSLGDTEVELNNTKSYTLTANATGDVVWTTTPGTGSVSLTNQSNSGVTVMGSSVGTATVTATVGNYSASCEFTVLEYAEDWTFVSIAIVTSEGFVNSYQQGATFVKTGIAVNYTEHSDTLGKNRTIDRVNDATFNFDANKNTVGQFNLTATYGGHTSSNTVTITITKAPGRIDFGSASGNYNFTTDYSENPFEDNLGSVVTRDITTAGNTSATQIGSSGKASTVIVAITFGERKGVEGVTVNLATSQAAGTVSVSVYGDTTNDAILSDSVTGNSAQSVTVSNSYETINANAIHVKLEGTTGICLKYISYFVGDTVQEFDTASFTSLTIKTPATDTVFKVGQKFSTAGLVLTATDGVSFEKDFSSGFTTTFDANKTSAFEEGDVGNNKTVTISLTIGSTTKTVSYTIDVINPPTYSKVTDFSTLYEGAKVLIVNTTNEVAIGTYNVGSYYNEESVTFDDKDATVIADGGSATEFTVRIFGDRVAFQYGVNYLSYNGSGNNAHQTTVLGENASWTYNDTGLLSSTSGRYLESNHGATRFACYTASQTKVELYISSASTKTDALAADTFTYRYLHMRDYQGSEGVAGSNYCLNNGDGAGKNYFADAAEAYASLEPSVKAEFKKNTEAVKRFNAWAAANSKSIDLDTGIVSAAGANRVDFGGIASDPNLPLIITFVAIGTVAAGGAFLFVRKRRNED